MWLYWYKGKYKADRIVFVFSPGIKISYFHGLLPNSIHSRKGESAVITATFSLPLSLYQSGKVFPDQPPTPVDSPLWFIGQSWFPSPNHLLLKENWIAMTGLDQWFLVLAVQLYHLGIFKKIFVWCQRWIIFLILFWLCHRARGILGSWSEIKTAPPALEVWSPNHWTATEVPKSLSF